MAIAISTENPGMTAELDDEMTRRLNLAENPPAGALGRLAGPGDAGWKILSIWESQEAWDAFRRDRLEPAIRAAGLEVPEFHIWQLHSVRFNTR
jgi:hypothetical protein